MFVYLFDFGANTFLPIQYRLIQTHKRQSLDFPFSVLSACIPLLYVVYKQKTKQRTKKKQIKERARTTTTTKKERARTKKNEDDDNEGEKKTERKHQGIG